MPTALKQDSNKKTIRTPSNNTPQRKRIRYDNDVEERIWITCQRLSHTRGLQGPGTKLLSSVTAMVVRTFSLGSGTPYTRVRHTGTRGPRNLSGLFTISVLHAYIPGTKPASTAELSGRRPHEDKMQILDRTLTHRQCQRAVKNHREAPWAHSYTRSIITQQVSGAANRGQCPTEIAKQLRLIPGLLEINLNRILC